MFGDLAYSYDAFDRLTSEEQASLRQEYGYDAVGNRTGKTVTTLENDQAQGSTTTSLSYASGSNRLAQIDSQVVSSDAAGNLTRDRANRELEYDAQGRLAKVKISGNVVAEYRYNALGQRTHKITDTAITTFLYGPDGQLLGETRYNIQGVKLSSQYYLWLDAMPLGGIALDFDAAGAISSSTAFYLHADHLNTPRLATNQTQQEVWRWQSDAFGEGAATIPPGSGLNAINLRFPGQYYDSESGLHYNYFRDYDPQTGRYVESDPIGLRGGLNTYGYVGGNPVNIFDTYGLAPNTPYDSHDIARKEMLWDIMITGIETGWEWTAYIYQMQGQAGCQKWAYTELTTNYRPNQVWTQAPQPGKPPLEHGHNHPSGSPHSGSDITAAGNTKKPISVIGHDGNMSVYYPPIAPGRPGFTVPIGNVYE
ncbi:putative deoxyribonuclease RhsC [compost metagenome]